MKHLPALLLGLPLVPALGCRAHTHVPGPRADVLVLDLTGLK